MTILIPEALISFVRTAIGLPSTQILTDRNVDNLTAALLSIRFAGPRISSPLDDTLASISLIIYYRAF